MPKVVLAFGWAERIEQGSHFSPCGFDGALVGFAEQGLELGEDEEDQKMVRGIIFPTQVDRIQVWAIGRQEQEMRALVSDELAGRATLVAAEIVGVRRTRK